MILRSAARTDIGLHRQRNEDRLLCDESLGLFGVADGIGGLPGGAEAAECTVVAVRRSLRSQQLPVPDLAACVTAANKDVIELGRELSPIQGIGTTLVFGVLKDDLLRIAHIGDSRCYLLRKGKFLQLTLDHNVETEAKARIARGEHVFLTERNRGALTRCIGQIGSVVPDILELALLPGDLCLFCTDGLYRSIEDAEFVELLSQSVEPDAMLRQLISLANLRGGHDNATGVLLQVGANS